MQIRNTQVVFQFDRHNLPAIGYIFTSHVYFTNLDRILWSNNILAASLQNLIVFRQNSFIVLIKCRLYLIVQFSIKRKWLWRYNDLLVFIDTLNHLLTIRMRTTYAIWQKLLIIGFVFELLNAISKKSFEVNFLCLVRILW